MRVCATAKLSARGRVASFPLFFAPQRLTYVVHTEEATAARDVAVGQRVGEDWVVEEFLGKGAFGNVRAPQECTRFL